MTSPCSEQNCDQSAMTDATRCYYCEKRHWGLIVPFQPRQQKRSVEYMARQTIRKAVSS